jgi:TRAP-type C4-dicarboxylate transport system permease small subunit
MAPCQPVKQGIEMLYIVAAGWLYVVVLMAASERSVAAGLGTFFFYGVVPLGVVLYLLATPARRRAQQRRAQQAQAQHQLTDTPDD